MNESSSGLNHSSRSERSSSQIPQRNKLRSSGITLSPHLVAEARKRNLDIGRIYEKAPQSILEYLPN